MNPIKRPTESLANFIGSLDQSSNPVSGFCASALTLTAFPMLLSLELIFQQVPNLLLLHARANQDLKNDCTEKIKKLANGIIRAPKHCLNPVKVTEKFMSHHIQEQIIENNGKALKWASPEIKNNREIVLRVLKRSHHYFQYASDFLKNDKEFVLEVLKHDGRALQYVSEELKNDKKVVLRAIKQNGCALNHAPDHFKNDKKIVLKALKQNAWAIFYVSEELINDRKFLLEALKQSNLLIQFLPEQVKNDYQLVLEAVKQNGLALQYACNALKNDKKIILEAVKQNYRAFKFAPPHLRDDRELVLQALKYNGLIINYVSRSLKYDKEIVLEAIRSNFKIFYILPDELQQDSDIRQMFVYAEISDNNYKIDGRYFFPKPLSMELKQLQLPILPQEASIDHLKKLLEDFIENLNDSHLITIKNELRFNESITLQECKELLNNYCSRLFNRVKNKLAYLGTPPEGSGDLEQFYENIEHNLKHLDLFFSKIENQFPNALIEHLQLLQTQSGCGARFQAEIEQLFFMNCIPSESMCLSKQLALIATSEVKKTIEHMVPSSDVHHINILNWQLHDYMVGKRVVKDHLAFAKDEFLLMREFLKKYTAKNLVTQIQATLKQGSSLEAFFSDYVSENFPYELNSCDTEELDKRASERWESKIQFKKSRYQQYQKAIALTGPYKNIRDNEKLLRILQLDKQESLCQNEAELMQLLDKTKEESIQFYKKEAAKDLIIERKYENYFDKEKNQWKPLTIALVLEKMGILLVF